MNHALHLLMTLKMELANTVLMMKNALNAIKINQESALSVLLVSSMKENVLTNAQMELISLLLMKLRNA